MNERARVKDGYMVVRLSPFEVEFAKLIGERVDAHAKAQGYVPANGQRPEDTAHHNFVGALGEIGVAKALNCYYEPTPGRLNTFDGDVDGRQVRATSVPNRGLRFWPTDCHEVKLLQVWILAHVKMIGPIYVVGWMYGHEIATDRYKTTCSRGQLWEVPPRELHSMEDCP